MTDIELIHAHIDGELTGEQIAQVSERLLADPIFRAHYEEARGLKKLVADSCKGIPCDETWARCQARLAEIDRRTTVEAFIGKNSWQLAACLFLVLAGVGIVNRVNPNQALRTSDVATAAASIGTSSIVPDSLRSWLGGAKKQESVRQLAVRGYGRGYAENGVPVERVLLDDGQGPLSLLIVHGNGTLDTAERNEKDQCLIGTFGTDNCVQWQVQGRVFFLAGPRSHDDLILIMKALRG
jgi:hypothetical protein